MKKVILLLSIGWFISAGLYGQTFFVGDGVDMNIQTSSYINVQGSALWINQNQVSNQGEIRLTETWTNNNDNNLFTPLTGTVNMIGVDQQIDGTMQTTFYDLLLSGAGTKDLLTSCIVGNQLDIADAIFRMNHQNAFVSNTANTAVTWNTGFVNTNELDGSFRRALDNPGVAYDFPLGSANLLYEYRPLLVTQVTGSTPAEYAANLADYSANDYAGLTTGSYASPFLLDNKEVTLGTLNPYFYHTLTELTATNQAVEVAVPFFSNDENGMTFYSIAQYSDAQDQWVKLPAIHEAPSLPEYGMPEKMTKTTMTNFTTDAIVLADLSIKVPEVFSPNQDNLNEYFVIEGLELMGDNHLLIFDRWGNKLVDRMNYANDWNGTNEQSKITAMGKVLDKDTYFYMLYIGDEKPLSGYFELVK